MHGRLYEYFQNRNLNAIDASNARTQQGRISLIPLIDNNAMADRWRPIWKDKLFLFTNQEYNPVHQALGSLFICAPTALGYAQLSALPGLSQNNFTALKQAEGVAAAPASPTSNCASIGATQTGGAAGAQLGKLTLLQVFSTTPTPPPIALISICRRMTRCGFATSIRRMIPPIFPT